MINLTLNVLTILIGAIFLLAGILKAINAKLFLNQLINLKIVPKVLVAPLTLLIIELECALGMALIVQLFLENVIPAVILLLISGFGITVLGKITHKIHTCSCYGHIVWVPLPISLLLNISYIMILSWILFYRFEIEVDYRLWQIFAIVVSIAISGYLTKHSLKNPLWDLTITRPGRKLKSNWFEDLASEIVQGKVLIVLLSKNCPICKEWVVKLNYLYEKKEGKIIGVMNSDSESGTGASYTAMFDLCYLPPARFYYMAMQFPTAILVEGGVIQKKWQIQFPSEFID